MQDTGILLPDFLWALLVGMVVRNLATLFVKGNNDRAAQAVGGVSLSLFLIMALMSMRILDLATLAGPMLLIAVVNALLTGHLRLLHHGTCAGQRLRCGGGRRRRRCGGPGDYGGRDVGDADADATPVVQHLAFLLIPIVGAFFADIANALVLQVYFALPGLGF